MNRFVVISGCSGGGKSTLLAELNRRGYATVLEPGRRIVREELAHGGAALPWIDATAFARRAVAMALADRQAAGSTEGWVFFDRSVIDAVTALQHLAGENAIEALGRAHPYHRRVFMTPPWAETYEIDAERRHDFTEAQAEYARLLDAYALLGYDTIVLPRIGIGARADYILAELRR